MTGGRMRTLSLEKQDLDIDWRRFRMMALFKYFKGSACKKNYTNLYVMVSVDNRLTGESNQEMDFS